MMKAQKAQVVLPEQDRALARDIFKQLIEINSQDSSGSVTAAAAAMRDRLLRGGILFLRDRTTASRIWWRDTVVRRVLICYRFS